MALFQNKYPYTDFHELNADWILAKMSELDVDLTEIEQRATEAAIEGAKDYVDSKLDGIISEFDEVKRQMQILEDSFNTDIVILKNQYAAFINLVNAQLTLMGNRIDDIASKIDAEIIGVNARTDLAIQQNNEYLLDIIGRGIVNVKVLNYFTGERVTIQEMFNYLALLHVEDGLTVQTMADRDKTVNQLIALNISCTDMVMHGNSLYV